jgi:hypothetical protein
MSKYKAVKLGKGNPLAEQTISYAKDVWRIPRLIELSRNLPVQKMSMSALNTCNYSIAGDDLIDTARHFKMVEQADLTYPIILDREGYIMDGRHRVVKTLVLGLKSIKFVRFDETPPPCFTKPSSE